MTEDPEDVSVDDADLISRFAIYSIDRDRAAHFRGRLDRRLLIDRCDDCGHWHHPPRPMCPDCWSWNQTPTEVSGEGTVHLLMYLHQGPPTPGVDYGGRGHPVATVELAEQPALRFTSTVIGGDDQGLDIGTPVVLDWIERDGAPFPVFRPRREKS